MRASVVVCSSSRSSACLWAADGFHVPAPIHPRPRRLRHARRRPGLLLGSLGAVARAVCRGVLERPRVRRVRVLDDETVQTVREAQRGPFALSASRQQRVLCPRERAQPKNLQTLSGRGRELSWSSLSGRPTRMASSPAGDRRPSAGVRLAVVDAVVDAIVEQRRRWVCRVRLAARSVGRPQCRVSQPGRRGPLGRQLHPRAVLPLHAPSGGDHPR